LDFARPARGVALQLIAGRGHYETVLEAVMRAEVSVWIATANLKGLMVEDRLPASFRRRRRGRRAGSGYRSVIEVFSSLADRGVELRILHGGIPSRAFREEFDRHPTLVSGGLQLRLCPRVHLKAVIIDGRLLYFGSANWTGAGLGAKGSGRRNFELGVVTEDEPWLDEVQAMFDQIWRGAECGACKLREVCDAPLDGKSVIPLRGPRAPRRAAGRRRASKA
jgi:phosphatidylserine/phosphatidylglycerophosphate/cardiolipin synthase-like enzyme